MIDRYLKHRMLRTATGAGSIRVFALLAGLGISVILARQLGPADYGTYGLVVSILSLMALPLHAGMPVFLMREMVHLNLENDWGGIRGLSRRVLQWVLVGSLSLLFVLALVWVLASEDVKGGLLWYILCASPLIPFIALNSTLAAILRGFKKILISQIPQNVIQPASQFLLLLVFLFWLDGSIQSALTALVVSSLVAVLIASIFVKEYVQIPAQTVAKYRSKIWFRSLIPFSVLAAISIANAQIATIIMGALTDAEEIGYMRIAERLSQLVLFSLLIVNLVSGPQLAERAKRKQWQELQNLAVKAARGALLISMPIAVGLIILAKPVVGLIFGELYAEPVALPLAVVCLGQLCNVYFGSVANVLNMAGLEGETLKGVLLGLVANIVSTSALVGTYGALGAAAGFSLSLFVWNLYLSIKVRRKLSIRVSAL